MKRIEGHHGLAKKGLAVVNTDVKSYQKAKARRLENQRIDTLEKRLNKIENLLERLVDGKCK